MSLESGGYTCSVVNASRWSYHATLVNLLKHSSDKLTYMQTHWVEKLMPYANLLRIIYKKGILNEVDPVLKSGPGANVQLSISHFPFPIFPIFRYLVHGTWSLYLGTCTCLSFYLVNMYETIIYRVFGRN